MKKIYACLAGIFFLAILFSSCSIEKRTYLSGYHIEWNSAKHHTKEAELKINTASVSNTEDYIVLQEKTKQPLSETVIEENNENTEVISTSTEKIPAIISQRNIIPGNKKVENTFSVEKEKAKPTVYSKKNKQSRKPARGGDTPLPYIGLGLGGASLVCMLIGVISGFSPIGIYFGIIGTLLGIGGLILSMIGMKNSSKGSLGKTLGLVGIIASGIGMIGCIITFWVSLFTYIYEEDF